MSVAAPAALARASILARVGEIRNGRGSSFPRSESSKRETEIEVGGAEIERMKRMSDGLEFLLRSCFFPVCSLGLLVGGRSLASIQVVTRTHAHTRFPGPWPCPSLSLSFFLFRSSSSIPKSRCLVLDLHLVFLACLSLNGLLLLLLLVVHPERPPCT